MPEIMEESCQHHAQSILFGGAARSLQHQVLEELAGEVHHPEAVLHPAVLGPGEDIVGTPKLPHAPQPVELEGVEEGLAHHRHLDLAVDRVRDEPG